MASPADKGEDPWNDNTKEKFNSKSKSKWLDPCQEAASKSIKCLNRNGGDRAMCQDYFECVSLHGRTDPEGCGELGCEYNEADRCVVSRAYRECKKHWINKRKAEGGGLFG
ncbi:Mitochondrial copper homeostasis protein [Diaporthe australafricana]|uniref:Mitochondrial copper homeostasis protein n=1 Tax=Diaporthe australafricana TaxID=127596 RepID=A0ABR3W6U4_9PEZI